MIKLFHLLVMNKKVAKFQVSVVTICAKWTHSSMRHCYVHFIVSIQPTWSDFTQNLELHCFGDGRQCKVKQHYEIPEIFYFSLFSSWNYEMTLVFYHHILILSVFILVALSKIEIFWIQLFLYNTTAWALPGSRWKKSNCWFCHNYNSYYSFHIHWHCLFFMFYRFISNNIKFAGKNASGCTYEQTS